MRSELGVRANCWAEFPPCAYSKPELSLRRLRRNDSELENLGNMAIEPVIPGGTGVRGFQTQMPHISTGFKRSIRRIVGRFLPKIGLVTSRFMRSQPNGYPPLRRKDPDSSVCGNPISGDVISIQAAPANSELKSSPRSILRNPEVDSTVWT